MRDKILFIAPRFFGYSKIIKEEIIRKGYDVNLFHQFSYSFSRFLLLFGQNFYKCLATLYFKIRIGESRKCYSKVFIIKASAVPIKILDLFKKKYSEATFILYLWDDIDNDQEELERLCFFDKVFSYSKSDCAEFGFRFRPMFYDESIKLAIETKKYEMLFLASYKENRFDFFRKISSDKKFWQMNKKIIFHCGLLTFLKMQRSSYSHYFILKGVSYPEMMNLMSNSKCALDIPHPNQTGLTTRPIEALLTKTKIISTNKNIVEYSLYCPENIKVIDEQNPQFDIEWINSPYKEYSKEVTEYYSLNRFLIDILS